MQSGLRPPETHNPRCDGRPGGLRSNAHLEPPRAARNPNIETRNSKQIRSINLQCSKLSCWRFGHLNFDVVSCFGFRISNFPSTNPNLPLPYQRRDYKLLQTRSPPAGQTSLLPTPRITGGRRRKRKRSISSRHGLDQTRCFLRIHRRRECMAGRNCIRGLSVLGCSRAVFTRGRSAWRVRTCPPVTYPVR
jgi:hypothetical protein